MPPQPCGSRTAPGSLRTPTPTAAEALPNRDLPRRLVHPFNVDAKGIFQIQQLRAVLAPLAGDNGPPCRGSRRIRRRPGRPRCGCGINQNAQRAADRGNSSRWQTSGWTPGRCSQPRRPAPWQNAVLPAPRPPVNAISAPAGQRLASSRPTATVSSANGSQIPA